MMRADLILRYSGFQVVLVGQNNKDHIRRWEPGKDEYEKNLFCTYMYRGKIVEYRTESGAWNNEFVAELFLNTSVILDYPTYEVLPTDTTWLCFSSYKPYSAEFLRLTKPTIIPAGVGAFCALGSFTGDGVSAKTLNYLKPREHNVEISGNAKIILIKHGQFVNVPT
jgi:hypothetical protein